MRSKRRRPRVKIGHASKDEHGGSGWDGRAKAGDQTKAEVYTRSWYNGNWDFVLRCKDSAKAEKMARACEAACANDCIGYDQSQRNTLNTQAKLVGYDLARIKTDCECDCSSLMTVCAQAAGIAVPYSAGNAPRTATMKKDFTATGMFEVLTDIFYRNTDAYLKRGDILVRAGHHTAMVLQDGTGKALPILQRGMSGDFVKQMQSLLCKKGYKIDCDGKFGDKTKTALLKFQTEAFPQEPKQWDGICGPRSWEALQK